MNPDELREALRPAVVRLSEKYLSMTGQPPQYMAVRPGLFFPLRELCEGVALAHKLYTSVDADGDDPRNWLVASGDGGTMLTLLPESLRT